jgi:hypothetical protein
MLAAAVPPGSFDIPAQDSPAAAWWRDSMETRDQRLAWWREARFGMFVHWGVYSHLGNEYRGRKGGGYAEHIQRVLKIPIPEYRAEVAGNFNPVGFDADAWIRQARDAGMGYFVITAKHHDGFAMWPSQVNRANVMDATPWRHDPMADLRAACRKYSVKFGFYYSHAFDWGEADGPGNDWFFKNPGGDTLLGGRDWWQTTPAFFPRAKRYVDEKSIPQLRELITKYDPDILWFDTPHKLPPSENVRIMQAVRTASPRVVINGRIVRGWGDYGSTADRPAEFSPHEGDWEGIPTTNESYGWSKFDDSHKPPAHFIRLLAKAAARGGNLLMNIGPMGDGRFDPRDTAILSGIGAWWKLNGESIRGTERTPLPVQTWGESTRKGNRLYLHVFQWPADGRLVVGGLKSDVKSTPLLAGAPTRPLTTREIKGGELFRLRRVELRAAQDVAPTSARPRGAVRCDRQGLRHRVPRRHQEFRSARRERRPRLQLALLPVERRQDQVRERRSRRLRHPRSPSRLAPVRLRTYPGRRGPARQHIGAWDREKQRGLRRHRRRPGTAGELPAGRVDPLRRLAPRRLRTRRPGGGHLGPLQEQREPHRPRPVDETAAPRRGENPALNIRR